MRRQPKARSTKAAARVRQFYELTAKAKDLPQAATRVAFDAGDGTGMRRQVGCLFGPPHICHSAFTRMQVLRVPKPLLQQLAGTAHA